MGFLTKPHGFIRLLLNALIFPEHNDNAYKIMNILISDIPIFHLQGSRASSEVRGIT